MMKNYLYYPNMEPPTSEWLKFSILYLDKFESIVPYDRRDLVSDEYKQLKNETDLVKFFSPTFSQGEEASLSAIPEVEGILRRVDQAGYLFKTINVLRDWRNTDNWEFQLYAEKFSYPWRMFCEEQRIGRANENGILLPKGLAYLYMTHLAKRISFDRNLNIITDDIEYDRYTNYSNIKTTATNVRDRFFRGVIRLQAPKDINTIPLKELIAFRNSNRKLIQAFNNQIDKAEDYIGNGLSEQKFIDEFNYTLRGVTEAIAGLAKDLVVVPFAFYALAHNSLAVGPEYVKEVLATIGAIGGGSYGIRKSLKRNQDERMCKRYLANLRRLR